MIQSDKYCIFCISNGKNTKKTLKQFNRAIVIIAIYFNDKKAVLITSSKSIGFDLLREVNRSLKHETKFIIYPNKSCFVFRVLKHQ